MISSARLCFAALLGAAVLLPAGPVAAQEEERREGRDEGTRELMKLGVKAMPALETALDHPSIEVRTRVRRILLHYRELMRRQQMGVPAEGDWPMLKRGSSRGASAGRFVLRRDPEILWTTELPGRLGSPYFDSPLLSVGTRIFVAERSGRIIAVDRETGEIDWAVETGDRILASPVLAAGALYVPGMSLRALDVRNGDLLWSWKTDYGVSAAPLVHGGRVFAVEKGERIVALDPTNGEEIWKARIPANTSAPVPVGSRIAVGTDEGLSTFIAKTGRPSWRVRLDHPVRAAPAILPDRVVIADAGRGVTAVGTRRGRELWHRKIPEGAVRETPVVYGDAILFATKGATFRAIRASDGKMLWTRFIGNRVISSPCVGGGGVYFTAGPRIHAMECADGDDSWRLQLVGSFSSPILVDGTLYFVSQSGRLFAMR